jgi:hypothetical protein
VRGVASTSWMNLVTNAREGSASEQADERMGRQLPMPEILRSKCRVPDSLVKRKKLVIEHVRTRVRARTHHQRWR